jgi:hypothetical protein
MQELATVWYVWTQSRQSMNKEQFENDFQWSSSSRVGLLLFPWSRLLRLIILRPPLIFNIPCKLSRGRARVQVEPSG